MLAPVPEVVVPPGVLVNVHDPVAGKPFKTMLPLGRGQVGWVIVPDAGAAGVAGWALITTLSDGADVHPDILVTV